jgi:ribokinase
VSKILVSGLINVETTLQVESFPLHYTPVLFPLFGVNNSISGVGYNVTKALSTLGNQVRFLSLIGQGMAAKSVRDALSTDNISNKYVLGTATQTPHSVILYDRDGKRQIHVDLKDVQERDYPAHLFKQAMVGCDLLAMCNINFSRGLLPHAIESGKLIATDVHTIRELEDEYNRDFMDAAQILFMSDELLPVSPEEWAQAIMARYKCQILVIGLGSHGVLMGVKEDNFIGRFPAMNIRPVVNTIGAGDALFSAFIHSYLEKRNPYESIKKSIVFASYKIGETSAAEGFLDSQALEHHYRQHWDHKLS